MIDDLERLKAWFANHYEHQQFKLSMGETPLATAGLKAILGFLAQGAALAALNEDRYLGQLVLMHGHLSAMIEDVQKIDGHETMKEFHYPLLLGVLIEYAIDAVDHLRTNGN